MKRLFTILFFIFFGLSSSLLIVGAFLIWLFTILFDKRLKMLHLYTLFWSSLYLWVVPGWRVKVLNRHKIDPKETYVMVSNHQSQIDILVLSNLFTHFKWVSKIEAFKIPIIGWNMYMNNYIPIKRGDKKSIARMMSLCNKAIQNGNSLMIFPEGTRSKTGKLRTFKTGAFSIALSNKVTILPIAISGTRKVLPKDTLMFTSRCDMEVRILDPIPYQEFQHLDEESLAEEIRQRIGALVQENQG